MKRCSSCNRTYTDASLNFCLEDGTPLVPDVPIPIAANATLRYPQARDTGEPPPTEIYHQQEPLLNQVPEMIQPQQRWAPAFTPPPQKSNAVWWILGGLAVISVIGIGLLVMIIAVASMSTPENQNSEFVSNSNIETVNRNSNTELPPERGKENTSTSLPASLSDDFSSEKWGTGKSQFGDIWYVDGEYHMRSKEKTFVVMYAPNNEYGTENATVRVTTRNVDGVASTSGYGLIVHGEKSKSNQLEDYALLIYTGDAPQYQIVKHKNGQQDTMVRWTKSSVIRPGTNPNQLEARIKGDEIAFYINGQYVDRITDSENFKRGLVGFYTSDTSEVAFDDLEISR